MLHKLGADMSAASRNGVTPLIAACARDLVEVIQVLYELDADVNAVQYGFLDYQKNTALTTACKCGHLASVRTLCILGATRICYDWGRLCTPEELLPSPGHLLLTDTDHLRFLERTKDFVNPLQYSKELTIEEARYWLQTEKLRNFPRTAFLNRGSDACNLIESGLVWSAETAALFPGSCRQR